MILDTLPVLADTLPVVVDTLPVLADSVATEIATKIGTEVSALVALALGALVKLLIDLGKKGAAEFAKAPDIIKTLVAVAFGQIAAFLSVKLNIPISTDIATLDITLAGAVVSVIAMGIHSAIKAIRGKQEPTT